MITLDFYCQECGRKFKTTKAAERALSDGCPKCGGCDVDVGPPETEQQRAARQSEERIAYGQRCAATYQEEGLKAAQKRIELQNESTT